MKIFFSELIKSKAFIAQLVYGLILLGAAIMHRNMIEDKAQYVESAGLIINLFAISFLLVIIKLPVMLYLMLFKRWKRLAIVATTGFVLILLMVASMTIDAPTIIYAT